MPTTPITVVVVGEAWARSTTQPMPQPLRLRGSRVDQRLDQRPLRRSDDRSRQLDRCRRQRDDRALHQRGANQSPARTTLDRPDGNDHLACVGILALPARRPSAAPRPTRASASQGRAAYPNVRTVPYWNGSTWVAGLKSVESATAGHDQWSLPVQQHRSLRRSRITARATDGMDFRATTAVSSGGGAVDGTHDADHDASTPKRPTPLTGGTINLTATDNVGRLRRDEYVVPPRRVRCVHSSGTRPSRYRPPRAPTRSTSTQWT